jgi:gamma-glutamyl phosphate reductase
MSKKEAIERINKPRYDKITGEEVKPINSYLTTDLEETEEVKMEKDDNTLRITDQHGELLLECEFGDEYHKLLLEVGLNKILKDAVEHWEGKIDEGTER